MERTIRVSEQLYAALEQEATRQLEPIDTLVESWLKQHLALEQYPELEMRQGPGGWRVGIVGTAIDVYSIVGYFHASYTPQEIAAELLPTLSLEQVNRALRFYAEYPDEIDQILAESEFAAVMAQMYRALGAENFNKLTGRNPQANTDGNGAALSG
jgi:uncharacterized protein (DUF433 family)